MAKKSKRALRGTVALTARNGILRVRFRYGGQRYEQSLGLPDSPVNRRAGQGIADRISADIALQRFDRANLASYFPHLQRAEKQPDRLSTVQQWQAWMDYQRSQGVTEQTLSNRYGTVLSHLSRHGEDIVTSNNARGFLTGLQGIQSPPTWNRTLKMLQGFSDWAVTQGWLETNPFRTIATIKGASQVAKGRDPFSQEEMMRILAAFRTHPKHYRFHDFAFTLMQLGLRPSECIGLQWKHINWADKTITIAESLSRGGTGKSSGPSRERRPRKTKTPTILDLPDRLHDLLWGRFQSANDPSPNGLVFTNAIGTAIDDVNFAGRAWRETLLVAGVPHRPPYCCRHSMASHAIDQGATLPDVAYMLGHKNLRMVSEVYGKAVKRPKPPSLGL